LSEKTTTIERRTLLTIISALGLAVVTPYAWSAASSLRLVLVHGRGQQGLDPIKLKTEWLNALSQGAQGNGRSLARDVEIAFPYYGDVLEKFTREADIPLTSDVKSRGGGTDDDFLVFQAEVAEAVRQRAGVTDTQVDLEYGANPKPKGPLNWEWVQAILRALDKHGGGINQAALETFTRDVYLYVTKAGVRDEIDGLWEVLLPNSQQLLSGIHSVLLWPTMSCGPTDVRCECLSF
jgi:hypothetical protein